MIVCWSIFAILGEYKAEFFFYQVVLSWYGYLHTVVLLAWRVWSNRHPRAWLDVSPEESVVAFLKAWGQHSLDLCPPSFLHFLQGFWWSLSDRTHLIPNPSGSVIRPFCVHFFFFRVMLLRDGVHYDRLCLDEEIFMGTNFLKKFTTRSFYIVSQHIGHLVCWILLQSVLNHN